MLQRMAHCACGPAKSWPFSRAVGLQSTSHLRRSCTGSHRSHTAEVCRPACFDHCWPLSGRQNNPGVPQKGIARGGQGARPGVHIRILPDELILSKSFSADILTPVAIKQLCDIRHHVRYFWVKAITHMCSSLKLIALLVSILAQVLAHATSLVGWPNRAISL